MRHHRGMALVMLPAVQEQNAFVHVKVGSLPSGCAKALVCQHFGFVGGEQYASDVATS